MPKYNNYSPDDSGAFIDYSSSDFREPKEAKEPKKKKKHKVHGLNTYDKVGHVIYWAIPITPDNATESVSISGDKIVCNWWNGTSGLTEEPLKDSNLLFTFLNVFQGVTDFKGIVAKEEIIKFTKIYGTLVAQPLRSKINHDNFSGDFKDYDSVNRFIEHYHLVKETYELFKSGKDSKKMRNNLNLMMKEITLGIYPEKLTGESLYIHDDPSYSDQERKWVTPPNGKGGVSTLEVSEKNVVGYRVPSLRACITIHLFDVITGFLNTLQCVECGNHYLSKKKGKQTQSNFCSNKCGNNFRVKKHRGKQ